MELVKKKEKKKSRWVWTGACNSIAFTFQLLHSLPRPTCRGEGNFAYISLLKLMTFTFGYSLFSLLQKKKQQV